MFSQAERIIYDGINSEDFGIMSVDIGRFKNYQIGLNRNVLMDKNVNINSGFYYGKEDLPLQFSLTLVKETEWTLTDRRNIMAWLYKDSFKDLIFVFDTDSSIYEDVVYSCMPVGKANSINYGALYGMQINFQCLYPYPTTAEVVQTFEVTSDPQTITISNDSDINETFYDFSLEIELTGTSTAITITNSNFSSYPLSFTGLDALETISINNLTCDIVSSTENNRYTNFNNNFLKLIQGDNICEVSNGTAIITVQAKFPRVI